MFLPENDKAIVDIAKLRDYCLNPGHPFGKHKAKVFASALGFTAKDAGRLRQMLLNAALLDQAVMKEKDQHGQRLDCTDKRNFATLDDLLCAVNRKDKEKDEPKYQRS